MDREQEAEQWVVWEVVSVRLRGYSRALEGGRWHSGFNFGHLYEKTSRDTAHPGLSA